MKPEIKLFQSPLFCAVALGIGSSLGLAAAAKDSADTAGFALQQAGALAAPVTWVTSTASVTDDGTNKSMTLPATNSPQFFRLRRP